MTDIYTLWATMKGEEPAPWMIASEDEFSWEGDPDRCEKVFADAREMAEKNGWDVREIILSVSSQKVVEAFDALRLRASARESDA